MPPPIPPSRRQRERKKGAAAETDAPPRGALYAFVLVPSRRQNSRVRRISVGLPSPGTCAPLRWLHMRCAASRLP